MLSTARAFAFNDDDDDFAGNTHAMPSYHPLLAEACCSDEIENAGELDKDEPLESIEPLESNVVFLWKEWPSNCSCQRSTLAAVPAIDIDDERCVAFEDAAPSPVTTLLSNATYANDIDDQGKIIIEDDDEVISFDTAYVHDADDQSDIIVIGGEANSGAISFADTQTIEDVNQDEIVLTSSGCSLKPRRRSARRSSEKATAPAEIMLTDTPCKLKAPSNDAVVLGEARALPADMVLSTEMPGCDLEESLYFTIGGMIIPSFFAEAAGHAVKTHTVSYDAKPSGWEASIDEISAAFEKSSALLAYLASQSDESAMTEAVKGMSEQQSEFFVQEFKSARAKGYSLFAHSGSLDGLFSVSVPVLADDEVIGAVGIFVPRALTTSDNLEKHLLPQLQLMAAAVAQTSNETKKATEPTETETSIAMAA